MSTDSQNEALPTDPPPPRNGSPLRDSEGWVGTDSKGWDGKLRVGKRAEIVNADILSDPDYSDEDAPPVEHIEADEGRHPEPFQCSL